jgi:hypothetical protein
MNWLDDQGYQDAKLEARAQREHDRRYRFHEHQGDPDGELAEEPEEESQDR